MAGNTSAATVRSIRLVDKTKPVVDAPGEAPYDYDLGSPIKITFTLSEPAAVTAKVYDFYGVYIYTLLPGKNLQAGRHSVTFTGRDPKKQVIAPYLYPLTVKFTAKDLSGNSSAAQSTFVPLGYSDEDEND
jgi:hypothetical protein